MPWSHTAHDERLRLVRLLGDDFAIYCYSKHQTQMLASKSSFYRSSDLQVPTSIGPP